MLVRLEPSGGELVEGRLVTLGLGLWCRRPPDPQPHLRQDVGELLLRLAPSPALVARAEREIAAPVAGAEAQGEHSPALRLALDYLARRRPRHRSTPWRLA